MLRHAEGSGEEDLSCAVGCRSFLCSVIELNFFFFARLTSLLLHADSMVTRAPIVMH